MKSLNHYTVNVIAFETRFKVLVRFKVAAGSDRTQKLPCVRLEFALSVLSGGI